jgi:hypothetical protein
VRAIATKIDEVQQIAELNSVGIICITESCLSANIPDSNVSIPGYSLFHQDRAHTSVGGGVCVYLDDKIPCKLLNSCVEDDVELIWLSVRPYRLPRQITSIILSNIYYPPNSQRNENIQKHHVQKNLNGILSEQPNALLIITGVFNPNSTDLQ